MRIEPFGFWEMFAVLLVILLLFGAKRLPEMAKDIGQGIKEFRGVLRENKDGGREAKPVQSINVDNKERNLT